ncbi:MAG: RsmE family RNA methyltransferase [Candidatus Parcubacteria bacterium]|nr:RsmE family RNA methyltransferase [Candidatus Parcubacteria bacterium]
MFRFFLNTTIEDPQNIIITDKDIVKKIIKVLRLKAGDSLFLFDNTGEEYEVVINEFKDKKIFCRLIRRMEIDRELPIEIVLYQSLLKKDKFEWVCQKVTEIGIKKIVPIATEFCVVNELNQNKISRYKKIIEEATMQSGGKIPPVFEPVIKFEEAVKKLNPRDLNIICHEQEKANNLLEIFRTHGNKIINIFVGPEGGFSPFEIDLARQNSLIPVSLGKRILRAETAGIVACGTIAQLFVD